MSTAGVAGSSMRRTALCAPGPGLAWTTTWTGTFSGSTTLLCELKVPSLPTHRSSCVIPSAGPAVRVMVMLYDFAWFGRCPPASAAHRL